MNEEYMTADDIFDLFGDIVYSNYDLIGMIAAEVSYFNYYNTPDETGQRYSAVMNISGPTVFVMFFDHSRESIGIFVKSVSSWSSEGLREMLAMVEFLKQELTV